jgi:hypothetical protein
MFDYSEEKIKVECIKCKQYTNHSVVTKRELEYHDENNGYGEWESYQIIQCLGCETFSFRHTSSQSSNIDPDTDDFAVDEKIYPNRDRDREPIENYYLFPSIIKTIYIETLKAFNNNAIILATIGLRSIIESICIEQKINGRSLEDKINKLSDSGFVSKIQANFFHTHRLLGNGAAHEMVAPSIEEFLIALDIAETILKTVYIIPKIIPHISSAPPKSTSS